MKNYLEIAKLASQKAREIHLHYFKNVSQVKNKLDMSLVSEADKASEDAIREVFRAHTPEFSILGEELGHESSQNKNPNQGCWIFDPLDGTTNYIHGYPFFCSSIALVINNVVQVGVVDSALFKKTYYAEKNKGAFCSFDSDTQKLTVSETQSLNQSLVATGFMTYGGAHLDRQMSIFKTLVQNTRGLRRSGAAALELCFVAEGVLDGFWEFGLQSWDTAAASLIIQEAGGVVTNESGNPFDLKSDGIVASNKILHKNLLSFIK